MARFAFPAWQPVLYTTTRARRPAHGAAVRCLPTGSVDPAHNIMTHNVVLGLFGSGHSLHFYNVVLFPLAFAAVHPDRVAEWIAERFGEPCNWLHAIGAEILILALTVLAMCWLMPSYPKLEWWLPLLYIGLLAVFRGLKRFVIDLFGFGDD